MLNLTISTQSMESLTLLPSTHAMLSFAFHTAYPHVQSKELSAIHVRTDV